MEWLGEIPEPWSCRRLKWIVKDLVAGPFGSSLTKDMYSIKGFRVYGQEQVIADNFSIGDYYITYDKFSEMLRYAVSPGDVLVSCVGTFGKIAVVPITAEPGIINPRLIKLTPDRRVIIPEYLGQILKSGIAYAQLDQRSRGGTMDVINISLLSDLCLPIPSLQDQEYLIDYMKGETVKIEKQSHLIERSIDVLRQYRTALITAAVTGKIDVRQEATHARTAHRDSL